MKKQILKIIENRMENISDSDVISHNCYAGLYNEIEALDEVKNNGVLAGVSHFYNGLDFYVPQLEKYGCALACMAMILNISYEEIKAMWPSKKEGSKFGIAEFKRTSFLWEYGFISHTEYATEAYSQRKRDADEWIKPFAPIHIVSCITENGPHNLIWLKDGRVYDPNVRGVFSINDYDVQEITGYWALANCG